MPEVVEINRVEELQHYRLIWHALLEQMPAPSFFHSLPFLEEHCRDVGDAEQLRVLVVYSGGVPLGILPLAVTRRRTRLGHVKVLTSWRDACGGVIGPIGPNPTATLSVGLRYVRRSSRDWDLLELCSASDERRTQGAMRKTHFPCLISPTEQQGVIDTSQSWEEYLTSRTRRFRENIERAESRVAEFGDLTFERWRPENPVRGGDPGWDVVDACLKLSKQLASETFFRRTHAAATRVGAAEVNLLRINGTIAAFAYNSHFQGHVSHVGIGANPQLANHHLETVLFARTIRESCEGADSRISLRPQLVAMMQPWLSRTEQIYRHTHYPLLAPRVQFLRLQRWLLRPTTNQSSAAGFSTASLGFGELPLSTSI